MRHVAVSKFESNRTDLPFAALAMSLPLLWRADEVGTTEEAKKSLNRQFDHPVIFETPKPERLLERIISIASKPGDIVMDSYLGSGTTAVAALRLGRRIVGIEKGKQAVDYCHSRVATTLDGISPKNEEVDGRDIAPGSLKFARLSGPSFE